MPEQLKLTRSQKLYVWASAFMLMASCFIESGTWSAVALLGGVGFLFGFWGYRVEVRHGR